ncbi:hypothetical protein [Nostoc sp.]|uniref:hypothetical protein n=1 Tax=Nostoc sp. TaxID=1180 RepID=UPI002FF8F85D
MLRLSVGGTNPKSKIRLAPYPNGRGQSNHTLSYETLLLASFSVGVRKLALSERKSISNSCHAAGFTLRYRQSKI